MRVIGTAVAATLLAVASAAYAQTARPAAPPPSDPISESFFPPELIMTHQQEIGLTDDQRHFIIAEVGNAQQHATEAQFTLQREVETMANLAKQEPIDEEKILAQADRVLAAEREIKRTQLALLVRIQNRLTPEQRTRLRVLRSNSSG